MSGLNSQTAEQRNATAPDGDCPPLIKHQKAATSFLVNIVKSHLSTCGSNVTHQQQPRIVTKVISRIPIQLAPSQCMRGVNGRRVALRLLTLGSVNIGVYLVYVRAIEKAKQSGVQGTFHEAGRLHYDHIVRSSYGKFLDHSEQKPNTNHE